MNPATGEELTTVPDANAEDVDRAVQAVRRAFESRAWRKMNVSERERIVWRVGELIEKNKEELGMLESLNNGKTLTWPINFRHFLFRPALSLVQVRFMSWELKPSGWESAGRCW